MITPEEAQLIQDLRQHMLRNVAEGKPEHEGLSEERLAQAFSYMRRNRTATMQARDKKPGRAPKAPVELGLDKIEKYKNLDLD